LHGSAATIGAVIGTSSLAALLMRPAASAAIATRGRRWTALWFLVMNAFAMALYIPLHSIWTIYAVTALNGFANGTARVALFAMIYEILPEGRQGEAMATFSLSGQMPACSRHYWERRFSSAGDSVRTSAARRRCSWWVRRWWR
jgi:MFS family permease